MQINLSQTISKFDISLFQMAYSFRLSKWIFQIISHCFMASVSLNKRDIICSAAAWEHFGVFPRNLRRRQRVSPPPPSPLWIGSPGGEPPCISLATKVTNCRARRASAASEWRTATSAGATTGPSAEVMTESRLLIHASHAGDICMLKCGWCWCWLSAGLSFCLNDQSIFCPSTFYQVIICCFAATGLTLTFGSHSFPSCCLAMPAWCWHSLKSAHFMTTGTLKLPLRCTWCSSVTVLMLQWLKFWGKFNSGTLLLVI